MLPAITHTLTPFGTMRARTVGTPRGGIPEIVVVQGLAVSDYLVPGVAALGRWTRATLLELPGMSGSSDPPRELDVREMAAAVTHWLERTERHGVVLAGHSTGTQVAAHAARARTGRVAGVVLASPIVDPVARGWLRLVGRWLADGRHEPPALLRSQIPEWRRAGPRRLVHLVRVALADDLDTAVAGLDVPVLVVRGELDPIGTPAWAHHLAALAPDGECVTVRGPHSFPFADPEAWSAPLRRFAERVGAAPGSAGEAGEPAGAAERDGDA